MRYFYFLIFFILAPSAIKGQSLKLEATETNKYGVVGSEIRTNFSLTNTTDKTIYVLVSAVKQEIGSSQKSFICINNDCSDDNIALQKQIIKILPGQTNHGISAMLETGLVRGISSVKYQFVNRDNPDDFTDIELQYSINERIKEGVLYASKEVELSDVYPNPASITAIFDYSLQDSDKDAKIVIHNVLGTVAGEFELNPFESRLKFSVEDYSPGVYFYTLYINNEGVATKKMVVKK